MSRISRRPASWRSSLLPAGDRRRLDPLAELGHALVEAGEFARAEQALVEATAGAAAAGDMRIEARAQLALSKLRYSTAPGEIEEHRRQAELAIRVFDGAGDELGLARAWVGSYLARALTLQGRYAEVERLAASVEQLDPTGIAEIASARCARARAVAGLGRPDEGERLAREAVAQIDRTDFLIDRADARVDLAEVLRLGGSLEESASILREARELNELKGNIVSSEKVGLLLADLAGETAAP
ncbi:MAG: hypothetical protein M3Q31_25585 [Actinomycetota bacterium]|nr:hypothetical protein [Actinomycetota bacterium]